MDDLQDKRALVTGASRNIGRAIALRLARSGCNLMVAAGSDGAGIEETRATAAGHGVEAHAMCADLSSTAGCESLAGAALEALGRIDVLVHTVAVRPHEPFDELDLGAWDTVRSLVLDSAVRLTRLTLPSMLEHGYGRIVLFTGVGSYLGKPERAHVSAAKLGLVGLARGLASEFAGRNIRVNVVSPGKIDAARANPQWYAKSPIDAGGIPMGRLGTVEEIADATHFLVSDASGFVTGQTLHVNGGEAYFG